MKTFIDTNVILEYLMHREHFAEAEEALDFLQDSGHTMCMSVGGFYTILFVVDKFLRKEMGMEKHERTMRLRTIMTQLLDSFIVAEHNKYSLQQAMVDAEFTDLEDSCQYQVAKKEGCEVLITFNIADYIGLNNVVEPSTFMEKVRNNIFT